MKLEDRIRATLHTEAERFQPELTTTIESRPTGTRWLMPMGAVAAVLFMVGLAVYLARPVPPADTVTPPQTTTPQPVTTAPPTSAPYVPPGLAPWVPEYSIENGVAHLVVTFIDGSTAELRWPEELELMSEGVYPYGWGYIPEVAARDFFIRRGSVEDVVGQFGPPTVIDEYPDGRGGTVALWSPEGAGTNFLGFQFDEWAVLVYEGGSLVLTPPMSQDQRELWVRSFQGEASPDGFLHLYGDEPLRIAGAGDYPSPMSLTFSSREGSIDLVPEECEPGFVGDPIGDGEFVHWCDESGLISVRIGGTPQFQESVYEGLDIAAVHLAGIEGPDANGSYAHLRDALRLAAERWAAIQADVNVGQGRPPAYSLSLTGHIGFGSFDFSVVVRDDVATLERGQPWGDPQLPTLETLFGMIDAAIERGDRVWARFHTRDGYPSWIAWDDPDAIDDESGLFIQLERLD